MNTNWQHIVPAIIDGLRATMPLEAIAVIAGIWSVWLARREHIWLYPIGLINTVLYTYISLKGQLFGEASVNVYYTIVSIWGWWLWNKKKEGKPELPVTFSTRKEWLHQLLFCAGFYVVLFASLTFLKKYFAPDAIPWADAFAASTAYTGMWLMARKKVESWYWWLATDIASIPLYFVKGYAFSSVQFIVFTLLAVAGLLMWHRKAQHQRTQASFTSIIV